MTDGPTPPLRGDSLSDQVRGAMASAGRPGLSRELLVAILRSGGLRVGEAAIGLVALAMLARALNADGLGLYAMATAAMLLLGIPANAGLHVLVTREVAIAIAEGEYGRIRGVLTFSTITVSVMCAVLAAIVIVGLEVFRAENWAERSAPFEWALLLLPITALGNLRAAALRGLRRTVAGQLPELLIRPLAFTALLAVPFLMFPGWLTPVRAIFLQTAAAGLGFVVGAVLLWRAMPKEVGAAKPTYRARAWLSSALPISMIDGLRTAQPQAAIMLLGLLASSEAAGLFRLAQRAGDLVGFGQSTVTLVAGPYLARLYATKEHGRLQWLATRTAQAAMASAGLVAVALVLLGALLLGEVFGEQFKAAYPTLLIITAAQLINAFFGLNATLLIMARQERTVTAAFLAGVLAQLALSFVLIPRYADQGAAFTLLLSFLIWNVTLWYAARRQLGVRTTAFGL